MSIQIPTAIPAYQLPDGSLARSPEEYAAKMIESTAAERAKAHVATLTEAGPAQKTRVYNAVKNFLMEEAGRNATQAAQ